MERFYQAFLHPLLEDSRLTWSERKSNLGLHGGNEHFSKELFEHLIKSYIRKISWARDNIILNRKQKYIAWKKKKETRQVYFAAIEIGSIPAPYPSARLLTNIGKASTCHERNERLTKSWQGWGMEPIPTTKKCGLLYYFCSMVY